MSAREDLRVVHLKIYDSKRSEAKHSRSMTCLANLAISPPRQEAPGSGVKYSSMEIYPLISDTYMDSQMIHNTADPLPAGFI